MKQDKLNIFKTKYFMPSLFIILVSILISLPMFSKNFSAQYDDGIQHICRIIGTSQSISEKQLFPVIMSKFCNNFGYSWNLFYSPITSYIPLIFRIFGLSYTMCLKVFMLVISIGTGFSMYFFIRKILKEKIEDTKSNLIAILASVLYILVPYRLNDMYFRIAIAELASFIFIPIVFNGLYTIINLKEKSYLLILGSSGMLLIHSMLTIYLVLFCLIYFIINIKLINKKTLLTLILNVGIILLLTSFYWIPLLESKINTNYEVFNQEHMVNFDKMIQLKPNILELLIFVNGQYYGLGILNIIGIFCSFLVLSKIKDKKNYILFLVLGIISTIMVLDFFPFEKLPKLFTMMQFSFRMLEFSAFFLTVTSSIGLVLILNKVNINTILIMSAISLILVTTVIPFLGKGEFYSEQELINTIPITEKTGRVHAGCASFEYLPSKAFNNLNYIINREDKPIILNSNDCTITNYLKEGTNCSFNIQIDVSTKAEDNLIIELPYIYYIGYTVTYEEENGNIKSVPTFESDNGFVAINLPVKDTKINVKYTGTILMKIAYTISILTFASLIIYIICRKREEYTSTRKS